MTTGKALPPWLKDGQYRSWETEWATRFPLALSEMLLPSKPLDTIDAQPLARWGINWLAARLGAAAQATGGGDRDAAYLHARHGCGDSGGCRRIDPDLRGVRSAGGLEATRLLVVAAVRGARDVATPELRVDDPLVSLALGLESSTSTLARRLGLKSPSEK